MMTAPSLRRLTSAELVSRALRAYGRLFHLIAADEPDLGANVVFALGRAKLLRLTGGEPWEPEPAAAAAAAELIETVARISDPRTAETWLYAFPDKVLERLTRGPRGARAGIALSVG